jgi:hypothetical protein
VTAGDTDLGPQIPPGDEPLTYLDHAGGDTLPAQLRHGIVPAAEAPEYDATVDHPFTTRQLLRLDEALRLADQSTGLTFSIYLGDLDEPVRAAAEKLHGQLSDPAHGVLLAVSPNQRVLEIVTGPEARKRISDRDAKLAALSMAAAFTGGDLAGGLVSGLDQLASHAGRS